jgi:hypothetical protein
MRKIRWSFVSTIILVFILFGCNTKQSKLIIGTWQIISENGVKNNKSNNEITFNKDGTVINSNPDVRTKWKFKDDSTIVIYIIKENDYPENGKLKHHQDVIEVIMSNVKFTDDKMLFTQESTDVVLQRKIVNNSENSPDKSVKENKHEFKNKKGEKIYSHEDFETLFYGKPQEYVAERLGYRHPTNDDEFGLHIDNGRYNAVYFYNDITYKSDPNILDHKVRLAFSDAGLVSIITYTP